MHHSYRPTLLATALGLTLFGNPSAQAQSLQLEEVIVTAQKREQSLQDVPIAVSVLSGEKINDIGITDLEELTLYIPNVNINQGQATSNLFIRGVGSGTNAGFEQSVGLYIDGIYSGRGQLARVPLTLDLKHVEVLKGPQGILFGKNTIAGAVNITSARPTYELEGYAEVLWEPEDDEQIYTGVISGGLSDTLAGRLAVRYEGMDGWWDNETLDTEGPDRDNLFIRGSVLWDAADDIEVLAKYEYGDFETVGRPQVVYQSDQPTNFEGVSPFPVIDDHDRGAGDVADSDDTQIEVAAVTVNWENSLGTFTSVTGYAAYDTDRVSNSDISPVAALNRTTEEDYEQFSQEIRLVSPGGETFDWIVGAYYQQSKLDVSRVSVDLDFAQAGPLSVPALVFTTDERTPSEFDQDSTSWAIFGQGTYAITDTWRFTLGLRYNEEEKDLDKSVNADGLGARFGNSVVFANPATGILIQDLRSHSFQGLSRDEEEFTWSANLQWDVTNDAMLYASVSTGFKGGGFDEAYTGAGETARTGNIFTGEPDGGVVATGVDPDRDIAYDEETVLAYEIGGKMSLADGAANLNFAIFRMEYDDLQVSSLQGDVFRVGNAGEAVSQGVEVDGLWRLTEGLTIGGSLAYLDATYDEFEGATCTIPQANDPANNPGCETGGQDLSGETLLFAPEWSGNLNVEWVLPLSSAIELRNNLDVNYTDEFFSALDLDENTRHESATKVNLRIALASTDDQWSVALVGNNLTDKQTMIWRNDVALTNSNTYFGVPERGRSVAIQGRYRF